MSFEKIASAKLDAEKVDALKVQIEALESEMKSMVSKIVRNGQMAQRDFGNLNPEQQDVVIDRMSDYLDTKYGPSVTEYLAYSSVAGILTPMFSSQSSGEVKILIASLSAAGVALVIKLVDAYKASQARKFLNSQQ